MKNSVSVGGKRNPLYFVGLGIVLAIAVLSSSIFAAGVLDTTFGTGGNVSFRFGGTSDLAYSGVLQPDGKIVIVGTTMPSGQSSGFRDFGIVRLNSDGGFDTSFGTDGKVVTPFGSFREDVAKSVILQPDGKIVVGGLTDYTVALARYNADGSLDQTFGTGGKVITTNPGNSVVSAEYLFLTDEGKLIVVTNMSGAVGNPDGNNQIGVLRYNSDGSLDTAFGNNGIFKIFFGNLTTAHDGAAMDSRGNLLISGNNAFKLPNCTITHGNSCTRFQQFLLRYDRNMKLDRKFGRRGGKEFSTIKFYGVYLQADNSILIGGYPLVRRFSANGRLETTFELAAFPGRSPFTLNGAYGLAQRPNGSIVGCDYLAEGNGWDDIGVVLFNANGTVRGYEQRNFFNANDSCRKILIQPDGKILIIGSAQIEQQGSYSFAALRYLDIVP